MEKTFLLLFFCCIASVASQTPPTGDIAPNIPPKVHEVTILEPIPIENFYGRDVLNLECSASGYPAPKIEWSFNGVKFVKGQPFGQNSLTPEGVTSTIRHTLVGNRLTIVNVKGKTVGDPRMYDSGRYRCIATNSEGSVFLETNIQIRVMGVFRPGSTMNNDAKKWNPSVGRMFKIPCPSHTTGYGTEYKWGVISPGNRDPEYWRPGDPNPRVFQDLDGTLIYGVVLLDDINESRDVGGLRCILINFGITTASNPQMLWQNYETRVEYWKPELEAFIPAVMNAQVDHPYSMVCGASGFPVPKITWEYQGIMVTSRFNNSRELNFEFFEYLGNGVELRIRRITKYSGGTFKCYAENNLGKTWKIGQLMVQFPTKWIDEFPEIVEVPFGNKYVLICNATGTPRPTFEWFQNSTKMVNRDNRKTVVGEGVDDNGGILTISYANFDDNGIYICVAVNPLKTLTQSIFIQVKTMAPSFREKPLDDPIYLFRTSTMVIKCDPKGGPVPKLTWKKLDTTGTGVDLTNSEKYQILENGYLQIKKIEVSDAGLYECTATNEFGFDKSQGTALVIEPTIITQPPEPRIYAVGWEYARLFCGATWDSRLDLRIEWYKGGIKLAKFSDKIFLEDRATGPPRLLYFRDLSIDDAGNYSCHAYTTVGDFVSEQWAHAELTIKAPPKPPAGVAVYPSFGCNMFNAKITWSRGEEIGVDTREFFIEFSTNKSMAEDKWYGGIDDPLFRNSRLFVAEPGTRVHYDLNKDNLMPGNSLVFRVSARSDHSTGTPSRPSALGECITPDAAPRYNPFGVEGVADGPDKLVFRWEPLPDVYHGGPNFRYVLRYRPVAEPPGQWVEKVVTDLNKTEERLETAGKNVQYEFYVQSKNDIGDGPAILPPFPSNFSGRDPPVFAPSGFGVERITRFTVDLKWSPVDIADRYRVKYWNITNVENQRGRAGRERRATSDEMDFKYTMFNGKIFGYGGSISNITSQVTFLAQVQACNNGGCGPFSETIQFVSQARVPGIPTNVAIKVFGDSALINWSPPIDPNGYIETYEIFWYESGTDETGMVNKGEVKRITTDRRTREVYLIKQFTPMVYYNIFLAARNRIGPGQDWMQILFSVSAPDIPGMPGAPKAVPFDDTSINITFQRPTYGGLPTKFVVYYRPLGQIFDNPKIVEQAFPEQAWILVKELDFLVYDFWTVGVNSLGQSEVSDITEQQPIRAQIKQARASEFEWWRSNWFIAIMMCILFALIMVVVVIMLLKSGPQPYKRLKDDNYVSKSRKSKGQRMTELSKKPQTKTPSAGYGVGDATAAGNVTLASYDVNGFNDKRNLVDEPAHDGAPPRYSSHTSIEKKDDYTGSESGSQTGSGSEYSGSETGSDYSDEEDGSYYSDEDKKPDSGSGRGEEDDADLSSFV